MTYEQNVRIQGNSNGGTFTLYHYGDGHNVELVVNGTEFSGYDYGVGNRFTGTVSGNSLHRSMISPRVHITTILSSLCVLCVGCCFI